MKAENLRILKRNNINVPDFIVVDSEKQVDLSFSGSDTFAVRSSFSLEDSDAQSLAGQFETVLNVDRDSVKAAVGRVIASAGNTSLAGHMRVIIQEMVDSDYSGMLFTANPLGLLNESVIVVGRGLGEDVVTDRTATTTYYYNHDDGLYYSERQEQAAVLSDGQLRRLLEVGKRIRSIFQKEMDIEFAIKGDVICILQARPITTLNYKECIVLDNSNIAESYPGISLPLTQSFVKEIYHEIFKGLVLRLSGDAGLVRRMEPLLKNMVDVCNGRIYYRISSWYDVLRLLPFSGKLTAIWQEMLGVEHKEITFHINRVSFGVKCRIVLSVLRYMRTTPNEMKALNERFRTAYPVYIRQVRAAKSISGLLELYGRMRDEVLSAWDITLINDMYAFIHTYFAKGRHADEIADIKNLESMKPVLALQRLAETAKIHGMDSAVYEAQKNAYIGRYGDRCLQELKLETRTYRTNPELLDAYIAGEMCSSALPGLWRRRGSGSASLSVRRAKTGIANREISRMNRTRLFGIVRMLMLKIGGLLVSQGRLEAKADVFYLFMDELREGDFSYKELVKERKREYAGYERLPGYSRLLFADRVFNKTVQDVSGGSLNTSGLSGGTVSSAGRVTGEVIVIDTPGQNIDTAGKIIVTKTTDPGWVFLIRPALGIIAERGSVLSHTAIITRELKKPSIVNVRDATRILKNGDIVELDAVNGRIHIKERKDAL